jgi:adenylate kinase
VRLLLLAPPGAGKGTQGERLAQHYAIRHLSTGDMLRAEVASDSELGQTVAEHLRTGDLVPDDMLEAMLRDPLIEAAKEGGYILDGFPRNLHQAHQAYELARDLGITVHSVLALEAPDDVLRERLRGRGATSGRSDDTDEVIEHRLDVYREQTQPLIDYYSGRGLLVRIDATPSPDEVFDAIVDALGDVPDPCTPPDPESSDS